MRVFQINTTVNSGSHGRIAEEIGQILQSNGHESYIAFGRNEGNSNSRIIKIGNKFDQFMHLMYTRLFDRHGFGAKSSTKTFIEKIEIINPDIIHLHNLHGYYLNIKILFNYIKKKAIPLVWTLHDAWPFTGHCSYFDRVNCNKWQHECNHCPNKHGYPESWLLDNSRKNFHQKKELFNGIPNLIIVTPSLWLKNHVQNSFLKNYPVKVIYNGVDLTIFKPIEANNVKRKYGLKNSFILGVANIWDARKGLNDFIKIRKILPDYIEIFLVGLNKKQISNLPAGIKGIVRTENTQELAAIYSAANVFVNPTYVDNFPTTNIEALACGTPVITYNTGGSPEAVDENTGIVVEKGDLSGLFKAIELVIRKGKKYYTQHCRARAEKLFDKDKRYRDYLALYKKLFNNNID
ncbi:glycosyltransferase family 4 protein [Calditrichota bacterium GD2]